MFRHYEQLCFNMTTTTFKECTWLSSVMNFNFVKLTFYSLETAWVAYFLLHTGGTTVNIWKMYFIFSCESRMVVSFFTLTAFL